MWARYLGRFCHNGTLGGGAAFEPLTSSGCGAHVI
jgi:hypothetical protein